MKKYILTVSLFAAFASACTINMGTPANESVSNSNSPSGSNAPVKTEKSPATETSKEISKDTSTKSEEPTNAGQKPERIEFAAGKTLTNLTRSIPANGSIDFVVNARSGQRMQYSVIYDDGADSDIEIFLTEPGLQDISNTSPANENNEFIIKKTGDHRITVNNTTGKSVNANFGISIK